MEKRLGLIMLILLVAITMICPTAFAGSYQEIQQIGNNASEQTKYTKTEDEQRIAVEKIESEIAGAKVKSKTPIISPEIYIDPEVKEEYQKFISNKAKNNNSSTYIPTVQEIQEFVDYAASSGIIENTPTAKSSVTKELVRASMKLVVTGGYALNYDLAAECLDHSLQDNPSDIIYYDGSWQSSKVKNGTAYKNLLSNVYKKLSENNSAIYYYTEGSMILNSTKDLFLALNKVGYEVSARNYSGTWDVWIKVTDTYNFEYANWMSSSGLTGAAATALNNYGVIAQSIGAVVPYDITV
jgi:hypothetical protein